MCLFCATGRTVGLAYARPTRRPTTAELLDGPADVILRGGDIVTMDENLPVVEALAVRNGIVQAAGRLDDVLRARGRCTRTLDLDRRAVIPGLVMPDVFSDPTEMLDWQRVDLDAAAGDLAAYLSVHVSTPLFSQPVFVRVAGACHAYDVITHVLSTIGELCGDAPLAVEMAGVGAALVNAPMLRLAGLDAGHGRNGPAGFTLVDDLSAHLRPLALEAGHTAGSLSRALSQITRDAAARGCTTIVYPAMGALAGKLEITAAIAVVEERRRTKISAAAHRRLREEWDGVLSEDIDPDLLDVRSALIDLDEPDDYIRRESASLADAGWRLVFRRAETPEALERLVELCAGLRPANGEKRLGHRLETGFALDESQVRSLSELGISCLPKDSGRAEESAVNLSRRGDETGAEQLAVLRRRTTDMARRCGLDQVAGTIRVGRPADFALLDRSPMSSDGAEIVGTWVDGIPVSRAESGGAKFGHGSGGIVWPRAG